MKLNQNNEPSLNENENARGMTLAEMVAEGMVSAEPVPGLMEWLQGPTREERKGWYERPQR